MAQEITVRAQPVRLTEREQRNYAAAFAASHMFKGRNNQITPDEALVVISAGQEFGWGPAAAFMNLHIIEGRPELSADAQARFIKASGKYEYRVSEHTNEVCEIKVYDVGLGELIGTERYTIEDARLAGLTGRGNWVKSPRNMLFARCISNVSAFHCPDALPMRTYATGEIDDGKAEERELEPPFSPAEIAEIQKVEEEVIEDAEILDSIPTGRDLLTEEKIAELTAEAEVGYDVDRFSREGIETRLRADLPKLTDAQRVAIKAHILLTAPWSYSALTEAIRESGFSDVFSWWRAIESPQEVQTPSAAITGRQTGSQTTTASLSDKQMRMFNARMGECGITGKERTTFLKRYAGVESSKQIDPSIFDDLLRELDNVKVGDASYRQLVLGGDEDV